MMLATKNVFQAPGQKKTNKAHKFSLYINIPVKEFWNLTLYDTQSRRQLQIDQRLSTSDSDAKESVQGTDSLILSINRCGPRVFG